MRLRKFHLVKPPLHRLIEPHPGVRRDEPASRRSSLVRPSLTEPHIDHRERPGTTPRPPLFRCSAGCTVARLVSNSSATPVPVTPPLPPDPRLKASVAKTDEEHGPSFERHAAPQRSREPQSRSLRDNNKDQIVARVSMVESRNRRRALKYRPTRASYVVNRSSDVKQC